MTGNMNATARLIGRLQTAWNTGDAAGWAACFAQDADFIHVLGGHGAGRDQIEAAHVSLFETIYRGSTVRLELEGVRSLGTASIVRLHQTLSFEKDGKPTIVTGRPSLVCEERDGELEIVFFQNTLETTPTVLHGHPFRRSAEQGVRP